MRFFVVLLILALSLGSLAGEFKRRISLEWEEIPTAKSYDVEIVSLAIDHTPTATKSKPLSFTATGAQWSGTLTLGNYTLRVRGRDHRHVPGDWSEAQEFAVGLETPQIVAPQFHENVKSKTDEEKKVVFKWKPVGGAESYAFKLTSKDGKIKKEELVKAPTITMSLPVATEYEWTVLAQAAPAFKSEKIAESDFALWGPKLMKPNINEPHNAFVRELEWDRPVYAENFKYAYSKWDVEKKNWVLQGKDKTKNTQIEFQEKWPGGRYKLSLKATSSLREDSGVSERIFNVAGGDRSPAAEEIATVRESIDRTTGWFGIASYLATQVSYSGTNSDRSPGNPHTSGFSGALGATARVGAGYISPTTAWGFLGIADYSAYSLDNTVSTFGSLEGNAIYRSIVGDKSEIRQQMGLFYKELPVILGTSAANASIQTVSSLGPHYGVEYWRAITPRFGFQLNSHAYLSAVSLSTPSGGGLSPGLSYQLGFLGSYRLTRTLTGLAGYAFRQDSISYQATDGSTNSASLTGNYLNLFLEWQL
jgi:hypothetical protein